MRPSSVLERPVVRPSDQAERPVQGVAGQVLRAGMLAVLLALAVGAPGQGASTPAETETRLTPARQLVELPFQPFVAPAPAESEQQEQPAAQVGARDAAPRQVAPQEPAARAPSNGGGDTNVVYDNGTNDTQTSSGGSHVTNDANLHTRAGVDTSQDDDPEGEDAGP